MDASRLAELRREMVDDALQARRWFESTGHPAFLFIERRESMRAVELGELERQLRQLAA